MIPHAHQAGDWRRSDPDMERAGRDRVHAWNLRVVRELLSAAGLRSRIRGRVRRSSHAAWIQRRNAHGRSATNELAGRRCGPGRRSGNAIFDGCATATPTPPATHSAFLLDFQLNGQPAGHRIRGQRRAAHPCALSGTSADGPRRSDQERRSDLHAPHGADRSQPHSRVELGFQSSSEPFIRDNPRGYRRWKGSLDVEGARLAGLQSYFDNRYSEFARVIRRTRIGFCSSTIPAGEPTC